MSNSKPQYISRHFIFEKATVYIMFNNSNMTTIYRVSITRHTMYINKLLMVMQPVKKRYFHFKLLLPYRISDSGCMIKVSNSPSMVLRRLMLSIKILLKPHINIYHKGKDTAFQIPCTYMTLTISSACQTMYGQRLFSPFLWISEP